ncbi:MAG: GTPase, partial [Deinococcus sp.]
VGYTNAGKSTLLNSFTHAAEEPRKVLAENKLFATLRPTSRQGFLEGVGPVVFTDTVGFIRDLPADLTRAFRATLEEIGDADLLLHVVDVAQPGADTRHAAVERILSELELGELPTLIALNKADAADPETLERERSRLGGVPVSAAGGQGIGELRSALAEALLELERQRDEEAERRQLENVRLKDELRQPSRGIQQTVPNYPHD